MSELNNATVAMVADAQTAANNAQTTANTANTAAGTAQTAANNAQTTANTANTAAGTAQAAANSKVAQDAGSLGVGIVINCFSTNATAQGVTLSGASIKEAVSGSQYTVSSGTWRNVGVTSSSVAIAQPYQRIA